MTRYYILKIDGAYKQVNTGVVTNVVGAHLTHSCTRSDVIKTPQHAAWLRDKSVWLPPTPYTATIDSTRLGPSGYLKIPTSGVEQTGHIVDQIGYPSISNPYKAELETKAAFNLRKAIKDQNVQFGAAVAETKQSISLIAESAAALAKAGIAAKHGDFRGAARNLGVPFTDELRKRIKKPRKRYRRKGASKSEKLAANRWLELQFGWKPLLSDIDGAAKDIAERQNRVPSGHRFRATAGASYRMPDKTLLQDITNSYEKVRKWQQGRGVSGCRFVVWYDITNRNLATAAQTGLVDILDTAWEVTPWSFVVDWIYPIGNVLNSLTATLGKEFIAGTKTTYRRASFKTYVDVVYTSIGTVNTASAYRDFHDMTRTVLSSFPSIPTPHFKNPFSVTHALDAIALLAQSARRFY